jgi:hypothetical protein
LDEEEGRGEFVLENERPVQRKFTECDIRQIVARAAGERCPEYAEVFARFGLTTEAGNRLQRHLAKIHLASLEAGVAVQQVLDARWRYDQQLKKLLHERDYRRYREYELMKPALHEYGEVADASAKAGLPLDPALKDAVAGLLWQARAYTYRSSHGRFDSLPDGAVGESNGVEYLVKGRLELAESVKRFASLAEEQNLPAPARLAVANHLTAKMEEMQRAIDAFRSRPKPVANTIAPPRSQ